jgi:hypothetical protein
MGAIIGVVAGGAAARATEDLLERFRVAGATAPDRAQPLDQLGITTSTGILVRYAQAGVICQTRPDRFYLDEAAYAVYRRRNNRTATVIALAAGLLALGVGIAAAVMAGPRH